MAPHQQKSDHPLSPSSNPHCPFPRPVVPPPPPAAAAFRLPSSSTTSRPWSPGDVNSCARVSVMAEGTHSSPAARYSHSQRWGPTRGPTSRPSGHRSACWDLSPSILANCGSPESHCLNPPHAVLIRTVPALLQVGTVSASLCHLFLCLFRKFMTSLLCQIGWNFWKEKSLRMDKCLTTFVPPGEQHSTPELPTPFQPCWEPLSGLSQMLAPAAALPGAPRQDFHALLPCLSVSRMEIPAIAMKYVGSFLPNSTWSSSLPSPRPSSSKALKCTLLPK